MPTSAAVPHVRIPIQPCQPSHRHISFLMPQPQSRPGGGLPACLSPGPAASWLCGGGPGPDPLTPLPPLASSSSSPFSCAADFVAEGLDQTRGWFYTLMVLSTALFDKPAFKNLVCNGLVLASDGKKMSKRLKNYPVGLGGGGLMASAEGWC